MACPITFINNFINEYKKNNTDIIIENFKKKLYEDHSIMTKYEESENIMLLYHKFDMPTNSEFEQECRSLVLDMDNLNVISYTCPNPIINKNAQQFLLNNNDLVLDMYKCYEGTIISLFKHKNKWYISTRRCLDSKDSVWADTNYNELFMSVINKENITFDEFVEKLNPDYGYYFILIHHKNKHIIDYTNQFGENYTKLCLVFVRDKTTQSEINDYELNKYDNIFKPDKMTMEDFANENQKLSVDINIEGIIIKTNKDNKNYLFKLQTNSYQFSKAIGHNSNIFKGYLYLYQNGTLKNYIENNKDHKNLEKIVNPYNSNESFDTVGVVDCVFKVLTSELFELYKLLWKLTNGQHQNLDLYNMLPKEYKDILYGLRGLYFKIKATKKLFGIKDIYQYLKNIDIEQLCALIRQRKLIFNWITISNNKNENLNLFKTVSSHCDKVNIKLIAIFTNKIFPDILPTDIPKIEEKEKPVKNEEKEKLAKHEEKEKPVKIEEKPVKIEEKEKIY
jgi:hypothetical protein